MNRLFLYLTIIGVPLSVLGSFLPWSPILLFIIYCATIISLSSFMGRSTESLSFIAGPRIGGLLNATFGNAVELIISIFALKSGLVTIVLASITGSVIGNLLLVAGLSFFVGGLKFKRQTFNIYDARHNGGLLVFAVFVAFVFPLVFSFKISHPQLKFLSVAISIIMILTYISALYFKLVTHRGVYVNQETEDNVEEESPEWGSIKSTLVLALATVAVAFISEHLVRTFETMAATFGWSEMFIGVIIVAIVGNAAEHATAVMMAYKNRMNVAVEIAIGSTLQIAMFVAPILVIISLGFASFMPLVFSVTELVAMGLAVLLTIAIMTDGDSNWFEGALLIASYLIMACGFYLL